MKLKKETFKRKDGTEGFNYKVQKLNEFGYGLTIGQELKLKLSLDPTIREISFVKDNVPKKAKVCNVLAIPLVEVEGIELHPQYQNAAFALPEKCADLLANAKANDEIVVFLRAFTDAQGKDKATWDALINGQAPGKPQTTMTKFTLAKPENVIPEQWILLPEFTQFVDECVRAGSGFTDSFGTTYSKSFADWVKNPQEITLAKTYYDMYVSQGKSAEYLDWFFKGLFDHIVSKITQK